MTSPRGGCRPPRWLFGLNRLLQEIAQVKTQNAPGASRRLTALRCLIVCGLTHTFVGGRTRPSSGDQLEQRVVATRLNLGSGGPGRQGPK